MEQGRKSFWLDAFHALSQVWPFMEPTPDRIRVYDGSLANFSVPDLRRGVAYILARYDEKNGPSPGAIRKAVLKARELHAASDDGLPLGVLAPGPQPKRLA